MAAKAQKVRDIVGQVEHAFGRQSHTYLMQLINDGLNEIANTALDNVIREEIPLEKDRRFYDLKEDSMIDIHRVEILDSDLKWRAIPVSRNQPEIGDDI